MASDVRLYGTIPFGTSPLGTDMPQRVFTDGQNRLQVSGVLAGTGGVSFDGGATNADGVAVSATANSQRVISYDFIFNGTTWDRRKKPNAAARVVSSAAAGNPAFAKASAGDVRGFWGQNGATITYLQIYNKASAPTLGTDTPVLTFPIAANALFSQMLPGDGFYLGTGIAYAFTTDAAGNTGAAAAAVTAFNLLTD